MIVEDVAKLATRWRGTGAVGDGVTDIRQALARRARLALSRAPEHAHAPGLRLLVGELEAFRDPVTRLFQKPLDLPRPANPRVAILFPGFGTHPLRMRHMAWALEEIGHTVKRWGSGFNFGPTQTNFEMLSARIEAVQQRYGQNVVLVGWSLGGIFAREMAKKHPDIIDKVVTMGSPFSHTPYSNNVWRLYQLVTGHSVECPPIEARLPEKPPVETVALWSPRDGVIAPRSACGRPGERDRAVALRCTHLGFTNSPEAIRAVACELDDQLRLAGEQVIH